MDNFLNALAVARPDLAIYDVSFDGEQDAQQRAHLIVKPVTNEAFLVNEQERYTLYGVYWQHPDRRTTLVCGCCHPVADLGKVAVFVAAYSLKKIYVRKPWMFETKAWDHHWKRLGVSYEEEDVHLADTPP
jgi:hypothetical protein